MNKKAKVSILGILVMFSVFTILLISFVVAKPSTRAVKLCSDGLDNDGDGYTDYPSDPGCSSKNDNSELNPNVECDDGNDNDGDSNNDMNDAGCSSPTDNDESNCGDSICEGTETSGNCPEDCGYPDSCSDTDNGDYPFVFGTVSGYFNEVSYSDDDYCVDSSNIIEYSCSGDYKQYSQQSCGTDSYDSEYCISDSVYKDFTDYFCGSGECYSNITPVFQEDCNANDGYGVNYCSNNSVYKDYYNYYCSSGTCPYTTTPQYVEYCSAGCTNGTCNSIPDSCIDYDGGLVYDIQSNISGYLNEYPYSEQDNCWDNDTLIENYCSGDYSYNTTISCLANNYTSCSFGRCI